MAPDMTDAELVELVQQKPVAELTTDEVQLLGQRLRESTELADFFASRLKWRHYQVELQSRLDAIGEPDAAPAKPRSTKLLLAAVGGVFAVGVFGVVLFAVRPAELVDESVPAESAVAEGPGSSEKGEAVPAEAPQIEGASDSGSAEDRPEQEVDTESPKDRESVEVAASRFQRFDPRKSLLTNAELRRWFEAPDSDPVNWIAGQSAYGSCVGFYGLVRMVPDWPADSALRVGLASDDRLQIHFFCGDAGVSIVHDPIGDSQWAAYATARLPDADRPSDWSLTSTDGGRSRRTGFNADQTVEIEFTEGRLQLSRGETLLVAAPLEGPPAEILFDGRVLFQGLRFVRHSDVAPRLRDLRAGTAVLGGEPAEIGVGRDDGGALPVGEACPGEVILTLDNAEVGDGIWFGSSEAAPVAILAYGNDPQSGQLCLTHSASDSRSRFPFSVSGRHLVRIVVGCGLVRWWLSVDGRSWAEAEPTIRCDTSSVLRWGVSGKGSRSSLSVESMEFREFAALRQLFAPQFLAQTRPLPHGLDFEVWRDRVRETLPADCDESQWLACSAIAQLAVGGLASRSAALAELVAEHIVTVEELPWEDRVAALDQVGLLLDESDRSAVERHSQRYGRIAEVGSGETRSTPRFISAWLNIPLRVVDTPSPAVRAAMTAELLERLDAREWTSAFELCRALWYYDLGKQLPMFEWAASVVARHIPNPEPFRVAQRREWRSLVVRRADQTAYAFATDLKELIDSRNWSAATEKIAHLRLQETPTGTAPAAEDASLWQSASAMIIDVQMHFDELGAEMRRRFSELADVSVSRAIAGSDATAVEFAGLRFAGTEAAQNAWAWLGKRALSAGWLDDARIYLDRANAAGAELHPTIEFLDALSGRRSQAPGETLEYGGAAVTTEEVLALRRSLSSVPVAAREQDGGLEENEGPLAAGVESLGLRVASRLTSSRAIGRFPERATNRQIARFGIDWVGRQLTLVDMGDAVCWSDRFQLLFLDAATGKLRWRSEVPPARPALAQDWSLVPMRPLRVSNQIVARQLFGEAPLLAAYDVRDGTLLWTTDDFTSSAWASDPWLWHNRLCCLAVEPADLDQWSLQLVQLDPSNGAVWTKKELLRLNSSWHLRRVCQTCVVGDATIAVLGGVVVCFAADGSVRWLREELTLPVDADPQSVEQLHQPPIWSEGTLFVSHPGVRAVSCVEPLTGRRRWHRVLPSIRGIIGAGRDVLVARERAALHALDHATGRTRWRYKLPPEAVVQFDSRERRIWVLHPPGVDGTTVEVLTLEGTALFSTEVEGVDLTGMQIGPLLLHSNSIWAVYGKHGIPTRDLVQLGRGDTTR